MPRLQLGKPKASLKRRGNIAEYALRKAEAKTQHLLKKSATATAFGGRDANADSLLAAAKFPRGNKKQVAKNQASHGSLIPIGGAMAKEGKPEGNRLLRQLQKSSTGFSNQGIVVDSLIKQYQ